MSVNWLFLIPCPGFAGKVDRMIFSVSCSPGVTVYSHILMGFLFS